MVPTPAFWDAYSVVRWTAPTSGSYRIQGRFRAIDSRTSTVASVFVNNAVTPVVTANVVGLGFEQAFDFNRSVAAGDTIDFVVGNNGEWEGDSTGFAAAITSLDHNGPITSNVTASPNPLRVNAAAIVTAQLDDSTTGESNVVSAEYYLTGGSASGTPVAMSVSGPVVTATASAPFVGISASGVYNLCVQGTDSAGNLGSASCSLLAVFDPSAGFVTGGGWIESPAGAYRPDSGISGHANFGFVTKYKQNAEAPSGDTQFHFQTANLRFKSTGYEWLVVSGARAQFKGEGAVNGQPGYRFMLTAIDGDVPGGNGIDRFRIRIWSDSNGLLYDNQLNDVAPDELTTALAGGSIVIHKQ